MYMFFYIILILYILHICLYIYIVYDVFACSFQISIPSFPFEHSMKSVQIRNFFWSVFSCIQSEYRKIRTEKTPYLDTFQAVDVFSLRRKGCFYPEIERNRKVGIKRDKNL